MGGHTESAEAVQDRTMKSSRPGDLRIDVQDVVVATKPVDQSRLLENREIDLDIRRTLRRRWQRLRPSIADTADLTEATVAAQERHLRAFSNLLLAALIENLPADYSDSAFARPLVGQRQDLIPGDDRAFRR